MSMDTPVDVENLTKHVELLSIERSPETNPQNLKRAFDYVQETFESSRLETEIDSFQVGPERFYNVLGTIEAHSSTNTWVVLAAHVDAVTGSPGADDNASGVAALLECARLLAQYEPKHSICLAATNLEEYGMQGALHLAERFSRDGAVVHAMLSMEMVGYTSDEPNAQSYPGALRPFYPSEADFIALVGNRRSRKLLKKVARVFREVPGLPMETLTVPFDGKILPATRLSDHSPFWDRGMPALMVTDTAFFRNPHYHMPTDTPKTLDFEFLTKVTEAVARTMAVLAT
jgi:Zn-dependent M28 family amino/carboxypeptidase